MAVDKSLVSGSTMMLILKLLEEKDMYGYEMIETLREKSENVFDNKRRKEATPGKRKRMERIRRSSEKCSGRCMLWIDRNI